MYTIFHSPPTFTQAAGAGGDSLQLAVKRETQKIPTVAHKGRLVDAATGSPVQGGIVQVAGDDRFSSISDERGEFEINVPSYASQLLVRTPTYAPARVHLAGKGRELVVKMYSEHFSNESGGDVRVSDMNSAEGFSATSALTVEDEMAKRLVGLQVNICTSNLEAALILSSSGMTNVVIAVAVFSTPTFARLVRSTTLATKGNVFVQAARNIGASDARILFRHILRIHHPVADS